MKNAYKEQLKKEWADENIEFWESVEELKKINGTPNFTVQCKKLVETFIKEGSPKSLNIPSTISTKIMNESKTSVFTLDSFVSGKLFVDYH